MVSSMNLIRDLAMEQDECKRLERERERETDRQIETE